MTTTVKNNAGATVQCAITSIDETKINRTVITDQYTATGDNIQTLGTKSRRFTFKGVVTGSVGVGQIRALPGVTGSILFSDDFGNTMIATTEVFYTDAQFRDSADKPSYRTFTLEMVEVV